MFAKPAGIALCLLLSSTLSLTVHAIELPDGFVDEAFITGLTGKATGFDQTAPDRMFISEKSGIVRLARNGSLLETPFLDISDIVNDRVDRGLLGIAVHAQFPSIPYVYVLYTYDPPELVTNGHTGPGVLDGNGNRVARLVRYTADADSDFNQALPGSAKVILGTNSTYAAIGEPEGIYDTLIPSCGPIGAPMRDCLPIDELSHTIGTVRFADDGTLYVTNGDGASYHSIADMTVMVNDLDSLRGKILRIDPETGNGLPDNPFFDGDPGSNRSRVVSFGLRNPYSLTIHPQTGVPYVGDVGWDLWEEINGGSAANFGWPCYSGAQGGNIRRPGFEDLAYCQTQYASNEQITAPVLSWERNAAGAAIIGDFYFNDAFPESYTGKLFYGDFMQGWMRYADISDPLNAISYEFATGMLPMTEIKLGDDGAIYYASITSGEIRRIRYVPGSTTSDVATPAGSGSGSDGGDDAGSDGDSDSNGGVNGSSDNEGDNTGDNASDVIDATGGTTTPSNTSPVSVGKVAYSGVFGLLVAVLLMRHRSQAAH